MTDIAFTVILPHSGNTTSKCEGRTKEEQENGDDGRNEED